MPFMKVLKKVKNVPYKKGEVVLVEEEEVRDGMSMTSDGVEVPTEILVALTPEEEAECLQVEEIPI